MTLLNVSIFPCPLHQGSPVSQAEAVHTLDNVRNTEKAPRKQKVVDPERLQFAQVRPAGGLAQEADLWTLAPPSPAHAHLDSTGLLRVVVGGVGTRGSDDRKKRIKDACLSQYICSH